MRAREEYLVRKKIIKFIGFSGSGKTTLIEKIVKKLSDEGVSVATIKHDVHGLEIDKEGKDSYRYSKAGAKVSVVSSPDMTVYKVHKKLTLDVILSKIDSADIILVEGYSNEEGYPCICVARKETGKGIKGNLEKISTVASDYNSEELANIGYEGPAININDVEKVIDFLKSI